MKFIISASTSDGRVAFQTASPEAALERARSLAGEAAREIRVTDMNGRVYDAEAFDACFVRSQEPADLGPVVRGG